jgi:hypothetical protein
VARVLPRRMHRGRPFNKSLDVNDASANVVPDGWDHEHCELCWAKISRLPADSAEGYSDGDRWMCVECFNRYVHPRVAACRLTRLATQ